MKFEAFTTIYEAEDKRIHVTHLGDGMPLVTSLGDISEEQEIKAIAARGDEIPGFKVTIV